MCRTWNSAQQLHENAEREYCKRSVCQPTRPVAAMYALRVLRTRGLGNTALQHMYRRRSFDMPPVRGMVSSGRLIASQSTL